MYTIITHKKPHLDEVVAIWLLRKFGENSFPRIKEAKVEYWQTGGLTPDGRSPEEWESEGNILIGIGRGRFDEHNDSSSSSERQAGECSATLVAKYLGIEKDPALEQILRYTLNNDSKGSSSPFDLANCIKLFNSQLPGASEIPLEWTAMALDAKYEEQSSFFNETKVEFDKLAKIETIKWANGRIFTFVFIESDSEQMNKFARSEFGCNADIVMIKRSSGNVQIFFNQKTGLKPYDLIKILRTEEQIAQFGEIKFNDWKQLSSYGTSYEGDVWYMQENTQTIMNGSITAKIPATKMSNETLLFAIRMGLNPDQFESEREEICKKGNCDGKNCPLYKYGLSRCANVRRPK